MRARRLRQMHSAVQDRVLGMGSVTDYSVVFLEDTDIHQLLRYSLHHQNHQAIFCLLLRATGCRVAVLMEAGDLNSLRWTPLIRTGERLGVMILRKWALRTI